MWVLLDEEDYPADLYPEIPLTRLKKGEQERGQEKAREAFIWGIIF